jgi:hypothetical protein
MRRDRSGRTVSIAQDAAADELLSREPLALVLGMLFDQHMRERSTGVFADGLPGPVQDAAPFPRRRVPPGGERGSGSGDRRVDVLNRAGDDGDDGLPGGRVDHVEAAAVGGVAPGAGDEQPAGADLGRVMRAAGGPL